MSTGRHAPVLAVTGAGGFCGAAVARLAAASGWRVVGVGRRPGPVGEHRRWDATRERPDLSGVDAVVHLAAAVGDPGPGARVEAAFRAVNVDGTARLLAAAGERPVVWVSSASVYRPGPYRGPVREDHPTGGQRNAYGRTKAAGEHLALSAGAVVLRPRAVYGPGDPHLLPRLRRVAHAGRAWLPGPDVPLSLTAVENLAEACLQAVGVTLPPPTGRATPPAAEAGRLTADGGWLTAEGGPLTAEGGRLTAEGGQQPADAGQPAAGTVPPAGFAAPWPAGAYNIADAEPYRRDRVFELVLGLPVRHVPLGLAHALAAASVAAARSGRGPALTRYAVDQLTDGMVLDTGRAYGRGWRPRRTLSDFLRAEVTRAGGPVR